MSQQKNYQNHSSCLFVWSVVHFLCCFSKPRIVGIYVLCATRLLQAFFCFIGGAGQACGALDFPGRHGLSFKPEHLAGPGKSRIPGNFKVSALKAIGLFWPFIFHGSIVAKKPEERHADLAKQNFRKISF
jgi:hypothetical protein